VDLFDLSGGLFSFLLTIPCMATRALISISLLPVQRKSTNTVLLYHICTRKRISPSPNLSCGPRVVHDTLHQLRSSSTISIHSLQFCQQCPIRAVCPSRIPSRSLASCSFILDDLTRSFVPRSFLAFLPCTRRSLRRA
jgi:hypothetical protein